MQFWESDKSVHELHICMIKDEVMTRNKIWVMMTFSVRVRNLKFGRNLKFATHKTLVNFMKKMILSLKLGIFQFKKP